MTKRITISVPDALAGRLKALNSKIQTDILKEHVGLSLLVQIAVLNALNDEKALLRELVSIKMADQASRGESQRDKVLEKYQQILKEHKLKK